MKSWVRVLAAAAVVAVAPSLAFAKVDITVDLDTQTMHVVSKDKVFDWKVSSGKFGYETPPGTYNVLWTDKDHHSQEYDNAPMPNAIFFAPGYAIHGASRSEWGRPASHGCVRLPVAKSALLWDLVKTEGAKITITGDANAAPPEATMASDRTSGRRALPPEAEPYGYPDDQDFGGARPAQAARPAYDGGLFGSIY